MYLFETTETQTRNPGEPKVKRRVLTFNMRKTTDGPEFGLEVMTEYASGRYDTRLNTLVLTPEETRELIDALEPMAATPDPRTELASEPTMIPELQVLWDNLPESLPEFISTLRLKRGRDGRPESYYLFGLAAWVRDITVIRWVNGDCNPRRANLRRLQQMAEEITE